MRICRRLSLHEGNYFRGENGGSGDLRRTRQGSYTRQIN
jgi:hypothetical protein